MLFKQVFICYLYDMINEIDFSSIDFESLKEEEVKCSWENGVGYVVYLKGYEEKAIIPRSLNRALQHEVYMASLGD